MQAPVETPVPELALLDVQAWRVYWAEIARRRGPVFARSAMRTRAMAYLAGLLSPAERKNSWQLAESRGDQNPYSFQHLLGRADWEPAALRDRLRAAGTASLHAPDAGGVLDDTGFLKKGTHSAGVARPSSGTAGRIEKSHMGVFLAYASRYGHTLLDRARSLPAAWTTDRERCRRTGIPADRPLATKPALARQLHHVSPVGASVFGSRTSRNGDRRGPQKRSAEADDDQCGSLQSAPRAPVRLSGPKSDGCSGSWWRWESGARHASCPGRGGAGGIKPGHAMITTADGRGRRHRGTSKEKRRSHQR